MDSKYILGIPEIDAQHEELHEFVAALQNVIADKDQRLHVHQALKRLYQTLVNHFDYEEAFMRMIYYPDLAQHKTMHKTVLKLFEDYLAHPVATSEYEQFGKVISDKVLGHIIEHDLKMTKMYQAKLAGHSTIKFHS